MRYGVIRLLVVVVGHNEIPLVVHCLCNDDCINDGLAVFLHPFCSSVSMPFRSQCADTLSVMIVLVLRVLYRLDKQVNGLNF